LNVLLIFRGLRLLLNVILKLQTLRSFERSVESKSIPTRNNDDRKPIPKKSKVEPGIGIGRTETISSPELANREPTPKIEKPIPEKSIVETGIGIGRSTPELADIMTVLLDQLDISWMDTDTSVTLDILKIISTFVDSFKVNSFNETSFIKTSFDETSLSDLSDKEKVKSSKDVGFLTDLIKGKKT
jgi:hypothetical protein